MLYLSVAGSQTSIKALRAVLHLEKATFSLNFTTPTEDRANDPFRQFFSFHRGTHGFAVHAHNLGCSTWHLVALSLMPGFMPVVDEETLWQQLNGPKFTTPVLRAWTPWLGQELVKSKGVRKATSWGCRCGFITADTGELDRLVARGLKGGELKIARM